MTPIIKGENILIRRNIKDMYSNDIPLSKFSHIEVSLERKNGLHFKTYLFPSENLRQGVHQSQLEFEIISDVSKTFPTGDIFLKFTFKKPDSEYVTEQNFTDIVREKVLEVSL